MKIVFLDAKTIGDDIDLSGFGQLGKLRKYEYSTPEQARSRTRDADVIVLNKVLVNEQTDRRGVAFETGMRNGNRNK